MLDSFECVTVVDAAMVSSRARLNVARPTPRCWRVATFAQGRRVTSVAPSPCRLSTSVGAKGSDSTAIRRLASDEDVLDSFGRVSVDGFDGFLRDPIGTVARPASRCWRGRSTPANEEVVLGSSGYATVVTFFELGPSLHRQRCA